MKKKVELIDNEHHCPVCQSSNLDYIESGTYCRIRTEYYDCMICGTSVAVDYELIYKGQLVHDKNDKDYYLSAGEVLNVDDFEMDDE